MSKKGEKTEKIHTLQRGYRPVSTLLEASKEKGKERPSNEYVPNVEEKIKNPISKNLCRDDIPNFPEQSEFEVVRHYTRVSNLNFAIDSGFYPLGSCTMKYNPKINEKVAAIDGFSNIHPYTSEDFAQGALEVMYNLQEALKAITRLKGCSLHPAAGAQGELVGVKMISAYHRGNKDKKRNTIILPDSAHGTNPASAALCDLKVRQLKSNSKGILDVKTVDQAMTDEVAALMVTVPNTLGIFEEEIAEISKLVHERGGLVYCDGANLNALLDKVDFNAMGVDVMHINLHKTFSTPHGGGGPGAGPVVVSDRLKDYLPIPIVVKDGKTFRFSTQVPHSIGRYRAFYGNFANLVRALCYIYAFGNEDLRRISDVAVLNANYIKAKLKKDYYLPYDSPTLHEVVFSDKWQESETGVKTLDIAKRLMDYGFHPPTVYFPLVVHGALMIEPTESEPRKELDRFVQALQMISDEAKSEPEMVQTAPHSVGIKRLDETHAARNLELTWNEEDWRS